MRNLRKYRHFNGYVRKPLAIVSMIVSVGILVFATAILSSVLLITQKEPNILQQLTTQIKQIKTDEISVHLTTDTGSFTIPKEMICDYPVLEKSVVNQMQFNIRYKPISGNSENQGVVWELIDSNGITHLALDAARKYYQSNYSIMACTAWIAVGVYTVFTWGLWYVLSNAPKYPILASLFVKKEWRNF